MKFPSSSSSSTNSCLKFTQPCLDLVTLSIVLFQLFFCFRQAIRFLQLTSSYSEAFQLQFSIFCFLLNSLPTRRNAIVHPLSLKTSQLSPDLELCCNPIVHPQSDNSFRLELCCLSFFFLKISQLSLDLELHELISRVCFSSSFRCSVCSENWSVFLYRLLNLTEAGRTSNFCINSNVHENRSSSHSSVFKNISDSHSFGSSAFLNELQMAMMSPLESWPIQFICLFDFLNHL